jgi:uncharacterized protein (DUF2235 family)
VSRRRPSSGVQCQGREAVTRRYTALTREAREDDSMPRNLVLCCDGTANEFARDRTNVVKLYSVLNHDPLQQRAYYHPGLGTMEPAGALTPVARRVTKLMGMAFGYGLSDDIRDAYVFLMQHYEPGDRVFMFGFSRGAYTVRAVAALLHLYGLIRPGNERLVPYAIRMMMGIKAASSHDAHGLEQRDRYFDLAREFKSSMTQGTCGIHFVGVWDTVSSVGWYENPLKLPYVTDNPSIDIGRHAIAIDERRAFFRTHTWQPGQSASEHGPRDLKQVWFPGVHCDVGGGYPEAESSLSKIALGWMLVEARAAGLLIDDDREAAVLGRMSVSRNAPADPDGRLHESLKGWWRLAEFVPKKHFDARSGTTRRRANLFRRRRMPAGALVHESAFLRQGGEYARRLSGDVIRVGTA